MTRSCIHGYPLKLGSGELCFCPRCTEPGRTNMARRNRRQQWRREDEEKLNEKARQGSEGV